ncbi:MAG: OmpH family outer membrane protein [Bacteroidales bacterium]|jgi:outer membrane protein|nr:OmpH family outer membrane protein [Bacteroidales bacterium]
MKNLLKTVFVVALATFANNVFAQKFAHINRTELIQSMPEFKTAQEKLEAYGKELQSNLEGIQVEYNKKMNELQQNGDTWTEEKREVKFQEIQSIQKRFQEQETTSQELFGKKQEDLFAPIVKKATETISKVAKAGAYVYVFESTALHYFDEAQSTNLLAAVKKELGIQ